MQVGGLELRVVHRKADQLVVEPWLATVLENLLRFGTGSLKRVVVDLKVKLGILGMSCSSVDIGLTKSPLSVCMV